MNVGLIKMLRGQKWTCIFTVTGTRSINVLSVVSHWPSLMDTYALEVWTSCQLLLRFCFNSVSGLRPSFLFSSVECLSLADRTWRRVLISSSTWNTTEGGVVLLCHTSALLFSNWHFAAFTHDWNNPLCLRNVFYEAKKCEPKICSVYTLGPFLNLSSTRWADVIADLCVASRLPLVEL